MGNALDVEEEDDVLKARDDFHVHHDRDDVPATPSAEADEANTPDAEIAVAVAAVDDTWLLFCFIPFTLDFSTLQSPSTIQYNLNSNAFRSSTIEIMRWI